MRKIALFACSVFALAACAKHDPILPGERTAVFDAAEINVLNTEIPNLPDAPVRAADEDCPYTQDSSNVVWRGDKKIFSGFPTNNSVKNTARPVCDGKFVYAGLTTGELVKINGATRQIQWIADIYRASNMTGGASVLDIVAPIVVTKNGVYAGGIGDAFCRINPASGAKKWCANIGVAVPFVITDAAAFVVATDGNLYAVRTDDGAVYWRASVDTQSAPKYANKRVSVGRQTFDAATGKQL